MIYEQPNQSKETNMRRIVAVLAILLFAGIVGLGEGPPIEGDHNTLMAMELMPATIGVAVLPVDVVRQAQVLYAWRDHTLNVITQDEIKSAEIDTTSGYERDSTVDERHIDPTFYESGYPIRS